MTQNYFSFNMSISGSSRLLWPQERSRGEGNWKVEGSDERLECDPVVNELTRGVGRYFW